MTNQNRMTEEEVYATWENCKQSEAFEAFDRDNVSIDDIGQLLGKPIAKSYQQWIYFNIK